MAEILSLLIQAVIALCSLTLVVQIYLFRRAGKYETCRRLHDVVGNSEEMVRFHSLLQEAEESRETARNLFAVLNDPASRDVENYREGAEAYARFLKYLFYIIKEGLVDEGDAGEIVGELISEYYRMGERMKIGVGMTSETRRKYFPEVPKSLKRELRQRYGPDWSGVS